MTKSFYTWSMRIGLVGGVFFSFPAMTTEQSSASVKSSDSWQSNQQIERPQDQQIEMWKKEAIEAADDYVTTLDRGQYAQSWEMEGPFFKNLVSKQKWVSDLNHIRKPLGNVISRQLVSNELVKDPYKLLRGEFILVEYSTSFENAAQVREILLLRFNPEKKRWYVGSYEILEGQNTMHPLDLFFKQNQETKTSAKSANVSLPPVPEMNKQAPKPASLEDSDQLEKANWKIDAFNLADNFLKVVDEGRYAQSWEMAGSVTRDAVTQADWVKSLNHNRKLLGKVINRTLIRDYLIGNPYNMLKSNYLLIEYQTNFENAPTRIEAVILNRDQLGNWHIGSYDIYKHKIALPDDKKP